jgi:DNA polymerase-1
MLLKVIQDLMPTHIALTFDRPEPTFRQKELPSYQAQRPPLDKELSSQFSKAKDVSSAMNIPVYEMAGFEADDLIGTLSKRAVEGKEEDLIDEVVIVTGDRDILQLVDEKVKVFLPVRGLSEGKLFGSDDVKEKMGVMPKQIIDYKALVGDASDNYKGVPGIGPKTAINLLEKYGSFENIYKHLDDIPTAIKEKLEVGKDSGKQSYKLAKIITDMEIDVDLRKASKWRVDSREVLDLFSEFGFKTLTNRVKDVGKSIMNENQMKLI